jgi:hypothetical protein
MNFILLRFFIQDLIFHANIYENNLSNSILCNFPDPKLLKINII